MPLPSPVPPAAHHQSASDAGRGLFPAKALDPVLTEEASEDFASQSAQDWIQHAS